MELQHVNVKLLVKNPEEVNLEALIPVFHSWIQNQAGDELLLDVADYRHVSAGPGLVLIGHQGNYSLDVTDHRLGVRYNCKEALPGSNQERLVAAAQAALTACRRLETDPRLDGRIQFSGRELEVFINDRLLAPNTPQTRAAADGEFRTFFATLFGEVEYDMTYSPDTRRLLSVRARTAEVFDTETLLDNLNLLAPVCGRQ